MIVKVFFVVHQEHLVRDLLRQDARYRQWTSIRATSLRRQTTGEHGRISILNPPNP